MDEQLWVAWIPTGKRGVDEGAVVGPDWLCRKKAQGWLEADPDRVVTVYLAKLPMDEVVTATMERPEPVVAFSNELDF